MYIPNAMYRHFCWFITYRPTLLLLLYARFRCKTTFWNCFTIQLSHYISLGCHLFVSLYSRDSSLGITLIMYLTLKYEAFINYNIRIRYVYIWNDKIMTFQGWYIKHKKKKNEYRWEIMIMVTTEREIERYTDNYNENKRE